LKLFFIDKTGLSSSEQPEVSEVSTIKSNKAWEDADDKVDNLSLDILKNSRSMKMRENENEKNLTKSEYSKRLEKV
jgi:hypothetical protein